MKIFSKNYLIFLALILVYTILFRYTLGSFLAVEKYGWVIAVACIYGFLMGFTGWFTGIREGRANFLFDAGFRWSLGTYLVFGIVSMAWVHIPIKPWSGSAWNVHIALIIWGFFVLMHLLFFLLLRRRTIKGVHKADIFE